MYEKILARRIRELRESLGIEQRELAEKLGMTKTALNNYENHVRKFPVDKIPLVAAALGVTTDYLFGLTDSSDTNGGVVIDIKLPEDFE